MNIQRTRLLNLIFTGIGCAIFVALLAYVQLAPDDFDNRTREFAISKVEQKVDSQFSSVANSDTAEKISEMAGRFSDRLERRVDNIRGSLDAGLDVFIADVLAAACELDCERRAEAEAAVREYFEEKIERYGVALDRVEDVIRGEYEYVMQELRRDLSIFSLSNAIVLAVAFLLAVFRGPAARHLLPVSYVLIVSTVMVSIWYIFGQDWVMTLIYNDYWGWGYSILLGFISLLLLDIAINSARVTTEIFNLVINTIGQVPLTPC